MSAACAREVDEDDANDEGSFDALAKCDEESREQGLAS
jgi:hypothetical protein